MKVLYYCPEFYFRHGGRTHARGFFGALEAMPHVTAGLYPDKDKGEDRQKSVNTETSRDKLWFVPGKFRNVVRFFLPRPAIDKALIQEIRKHRYDMLVVRTGARIPTINNIRKACPGLAICLEVNSAHFDEDYHGLPLRRLFQRWEIRRFRGADAITVVSSYLLNYLVERGVQRHKLIVNQNGVNPVIADPANGVEVRKNFGIPDEAFVIGYIGGMEPFRRLPEVVAQLASMRREGHQELYLLMVGDGEDMPAVQEMIGSHSDALEGSVVLAGWQDHSMIPSFLAAFDMAIFPFTNDYCSPLKLFEYLGAGIPTIGPDTSAVREVFKDGEHLVLVNQDGTDFARKLLELKADAKRRIRLARAGQSLVLNEYTWEKNAARVMEHTRDLAGMDQL